MSFEFIADVGTIKQAVDNMAALVDECTFEFREDELFLAATDPAQVAMVHQHIGAEAFEHYHANAVEIGFNIDRMDDYLGKINAETVEFAFDPEKRRVEISGEEVSFDLAGIDPDAVRNRPEQPDVSDEMTTYAAIPGAAVSHGVDVCELVSDHIKFETDPDREAPFAMVAEGDIDDARVGFENSVISGEYAADCYTLLSTDYLESLTKPMPNDTEVAIQHGEEFPVFMDWSFADGAADVSMMLAPRVE